MPPAYVEDHDERTTVTDNDHTTVTRNDEAGRYEIHVDGELAGFSEFSTDPKGRLRFTHTQTDPAFRGQGLGGTLVAGAMADVARSGETVRPYCPFVAKYLSENDVEGLTVDWPTPRPEASED